MAIRSLVKRASFAEPWPERPRREAARAGNQRLRNGDPVFGEKG